MSATPALLVAVAAIAAAAGTTFAAELALEDQRAPAVAVALVYLGVYGVLRAHLIGPRPPRRRPSRPPHVVPVEVYAGPLEPAPAPPRPLHTPTLALAAITPRDRPGPYTQTRSVAR